MEEKLVIEFIPKKDKACIGYGYQHFTFGNPRSPINGGLYVRHGHEVPDKIILNLKDRPVEG